MAHGVVCSIISLINLVFRYIVQVYCVDMVHPADFAMCVHTCKVFMYYTRSLELYCWCILLYVHGVSRAILLYFWLSGSE